MIIDAHTRYAGFWRRLAAFIIDMVTLSLLLTPMMPLLGLSDRSLQSVVQTGEIELPGLREILLNLVVLAAAILLTVFLWVKFKGTPGKLMLGCRIVDARSGAALSPSQAAVRNFAYIASALPFGLGFLWIAWDKRKQGFHDKIAKTVVILDDPAQTSLEDLEKELR